jgi:hypothetical protein
MIEATDSNSVLLGYDKFGHPLYKVIATPKEKEQWLKLYKMPDRVIPVVFLPGVMGSNLMSPDGKSIWKVDGTWSMKSWLVRGAEERKNYWILPKPWLIPAGKSRLKVRKSGCYFHRVGREAGGGGGNELRHFPSLASGSAER